MSLPRFKKVAMLVHSNGAVSMTKATNPVRPTRSVAAAKADMESNKLWHSDRQLYHDKRVARDALRASRSEPLKPAAPRPSFEPDWKRASEPLE